MDKHQVKGRTNEAKGKGKEMAGEALDDNEMKGKGKAQKIGGKAQSAYGDAKDDVKKESRH